MRKRIENYPTPDPSPKRRGGRKKSYAFFKAPQWHTVPFWGGLKGFVPLPFGEGFLTFLGFFLSFTSFAQIQVVTKSIQKEIVYSVGSKINLNAKKADIIIKGKSQDNITVLVKLIAKHSDRNIAEKELNYLNYEIKNNGNTIDLSNAYNIPKVVGKLQSQVNTVYEITLPSKANMLIINSFGDISVKDFSGELGIKFNFGKLNLTDVSGKINIESSFGDVYAENLDGSLFCKSEKAIIELYNPRGNTFLESKYGSVKLNLFSSLDKLIVNAARSSIELNVRRFEDFRFDLEANFAKISAPSAYREFVSNYINQETLLYEPKGKPLIQIHNSYSPITLQIDKNLQTHK